jgi:tetratricopeptide (TPR) repeat protein
LALLSKENGALLPVLAWVTEVTVVAAGCANKTSLKRSWYWIFLILPSLAIFTYLIKHGFNGDFFAVIPTRDFSIYERLLTQARILFDYLQHWFIPELFTSGIFHDQFTKSTGLFAPGITIVALLGHTVLIVTAIIKRKHWPLASFSILFFYAAHLIESTTIVLELYFEHRNYLPAAFLFLPFCYTLGEKLPSLASKVSLSTIICVLAGFTYYTASIWSNYPSMALAWAQKAPNSARAQQQASMVLYNEGLYVEALETLESATFRIPNDLALRLWKVTIACKLHNLKQEDVNIANRLARETAYDLRAIALYRLYIETIAQKHCSNLSYSDGIALFESMLEFPGNANKGSAGFSQIQYLLGNLAVHQQQLSSAVEFYNNSLQARPGPHHAMHMASFLASQGYLNDALLFSDKAILYLDDGVGISTGQSKESFIRDIKHFQKQVKLDLGGQPQ